ncbi:hypothetical protein NQ318_011390 [Aromia moschata]|uniref:Uncharacterized protein n=1 Tax=Aromia moschata TaxID=1265417 RepID=A0AAV8YUU3_9CUCU|nr:hypothetical protein NQ318_011390 [Aromia moschata]
MNFVTSTLLLALALFYNVHSSIVGDSASDLVDAVDFIECARQAILTGIPEANIPSHDPLYLKENVSYPFDLLGNTGSFSLTNLMVTDIPKWTVNQASTTSNNDTNVNTFNFDIYWADMNISADWAVHLETSNSTHDLSGMFYVELDHVDFIILWTSTKAHDDVNGTLDAFQLNVTAKDAVFHITNFGFVGDLLDTFMGSAILGLLNNNPYLVNFSQQLQNKLTNDWIEKPERIEAIVANCNK